jgi:hypothetical protein
MTSHLARSMLLGAAVAAAMAGATIASDWWDSSDAMSAPPPPAPFEPPMPGDLRTQTSQEYHARLMAMQMSSASFFELWRLHAR